MQARIALILRPVIIWITQAVITAISFWIIDKIFDKMLDEIRQHYGLAEDDARIVIANNLLEAATFIGVGSAVVAKKIPIKLAKKLGFANGNVVKRTLSKDATSKIIAKDGAGAVAKITGAVSVAETAEFVAATRGISLAKVKSLLTIIATVIGVPTGFFFAFAQYIDFANWQGPYQHYFQTLLAKIGIHPDTPMPKASVVSSDIWKRIYSTIEELEPVGVSFPYSGFDKPYDRLALADLVDEVAAKMAESGVSTSYKNVLGAVLPLIQLKNKERTNADIDKIFAKYPTLGTTTSVKSVSTPTTKVFTGIVSQGVVGQGLVFTPRPDDMIESVTELREAAANNLAPFLAALLGKVVYEVKVVSSIITKDGFKQTGTTQRIQTGTYQNGQPKYKTVTNKFATLIVYVITDKGSRTKVTTIVLGPVDSAKLQVGQNDLRTLETELPGLVTTNDINIITGVETNNTLTVSAPPQTVNSSGNTIGQNATNLSEWYNANGDAMPSISVRAKIYQELGLGQSNFYTGTAEQNSKLLAALKLEAQQPFTNDNRYELIYNPATNAWSVDDHTTGKSQSYATRALAEQAIAGNKANASSSIDGSGVETPQGTVDYDVPYSLARTTVGGVVGQYNAGVFEIEKEMVRRGFAVATDGILTDAFFKAYYPVVNADVAAAIKERGVDEYLRWRRLKTN